MVEFKELDSYFNQDTVRLFFKDFVDVVNTKVLTFNNKVIGFVTVVDGYVNKINFIKEIFYHESIMKQLIMLGFSNNTTLGLNFSQCVVDEYIMKDMIEWERHAVRAFSDTRDRMYLYRRKLI